MMRTTTWNCHIPSDQLDTQELDEDQINLNFIFGCL